MVELNASIQLSSWCCQQGMENPPAFLHFIGHKENDTVYGALFKCDAGYIFQQHKWTEINKNKPAPKVCSEIQYKHKFVSEDIYKSFKELDYGEYLGRECNDSKTI